MLDLVFGGRAVGEVVGALGWGLGPGISCGVCWVSGCWMGIVLVRTLREGRRSFW